MYLIISLSGSSIVTAAEELFLPYLLYSEFRESPETTQVSGRVSWEEVCLLLIQVRFKLFLSVLRPPGLKVQKQKSSAIPALPLK